MRPLILNEWPRCAGLWDYLARAVTRPISALPVTGEGTLAADLPLSTRPSRETRYRIARFPIPRRSFPGW